MQALRYYAQTPVLHPDHERPTPAPADRRLVGEEVRARASRRCASTSSTCAGAWRRSRHPHSACTHLLLISAHLHGRLDVRLELVDAVERELAP
jgi:hypothetical protein